MKKEKAFVPLGQLIYAQSKIEGQQHSDMMALLEQILTKVVFLNLGHFKTCWSSTPRIPPENSGS